jgi:hypothetical protein
VRGTTPSHRIPIRQIARFLGERITVAPQDIDVALDEVSYVEVLPVGAERDAFGEAAHIGLRHLAHRLSLDLEERHVGFLMAVEGGLGCHQCR